MIENNDAYKKTRKRVAELQREAAALEQEGNNGRYDRVEYMIKTSPPLETIAELENYEIEAGFRETPEDFRTRYSNMDVLGMFIDNHFAVAEPGSAEHETLEPGEYVDVGERIGKVYVTREFDPEELHALIVKSVNDDFNPLDGEQHNTESEDMLRWLSDGSAGYGVQPVAYIMMATFDLAGIADTSFDPKTYSMTMKTKDEFRHKHVPKPSFFDDGCSVDVNLTDPDDALGMTLST